MKLTVAKDIILELAAIKDKREKTVFDVCEIDENRLNEIIDSELNINSFDVHNKQVRVPDFVTSVNELADVGLDINVPAVSNRRKDLIALLKASLAEEKKQEQQQKAVAQQQKTNATEHHNGNGAAAVDEEQQSANGGAQELRTLRETVASLNEALLASKKRLVDQNTELQAGFHKEKELLEKANAVNIEGLKQRLADQQQKSRQDHAETLLHKDEVIRKLEERLAALEKKIAADDFAGELEEMLAGGQPASDQTAFDPFSDDYDFEDFEDFGDDAEPSAGGVEEAKENIERDSGLASADANQQSADLASLGSIEIAPSPAAKESLTRLLDEGNQKTVRLNKGLTVNQDDQGRDGEDVRADLFDTLDLDGASGSSQQVKLTVSQALELLAILHMNTKTNPEMDADFTAIYDFYNSLITRLKQHESVINDFLADKDGVPWKQSLRSRAAHAAQRRGIRHGFLDRAERMFESKSGQLEAQIDASDVAISQSSQVDYAKTAQSNIRELKNLTKFLGVKNQRQAFGNRRSSLRKVLLHAIAGVRSEYQANAFKTQLGRETAHACVFTTPEQLSGVIQLCVADIKQSLQIEGDLQVGQDINYSNANWTLSDVQKERIYSQLDMLKQLSEFFTIQERLVDGVSEGDHFSASSDVNQLNILISNLDALRTRVEAVPASHSRLAAVVSSLMSAVGGMSAALASGGATPENVDINNPLHSHRLNVSPRSSNDGSGSNPFTSTAADLNGSTVGDHLIGTNDQVPTLESSIITNAGKIAAWVDEEAGRKNPSHRFTAQVSMSRFWEQTRQKELDMLACLYVMEPTTLSDASLMAIHDVCRQSESGDGSSITDQDKIALAKTMLKQRATKILDLQKPLTDHLNSEQALIDQQRSLQIQNSFGEKPESLAEGMPNIEKLFADLKGFCSAGNHGQNALTKIVECQTLIDASLIKYRNTPETCLDPRFVQGLIDKFNELKGLKDEAEAGSPDLLPADSISAVDTMIESLGQLKASIEANNAEFDKFDEEHQRLKGQIKEGRLALTEQPIGVIENHGGSASADSPVDKEVCQQALVACLKDLDDQTKTMFTGRSSTVSNLLAAMGIDRQSPLTLGDISLCQTPRGGVASSRSGTFSQPSSGALSEDRQNGGGAAEEKDERALGNGFQQKH